MMKLIKYGCAVIIVAVSIYYWKRSPNISLTVEAPSAVVLAPVSKPTKPAAALSFPTQVFEKNTTPMIVGLSPDELAQFKPHMAEFVLLKSKVLKTDNETENWSSILKNPHAIYRARKILLAPSRDHRDLQDQAIDYLVSAAKAGDPNAQAALESVIADASIESAGGDRPTQQFKAEIKAVALFEWSSANPDIDSRIAELLPGPVSQRIWKNVLAQQATNIEESQLEIKLSQ